ncbi:MAG TPA: acyl carrier protein [Gemmatimonadales bacterium]|jgi:acyl carrier protein
MNTDTAGTLGEIFRVVFNLPEGTDVRHFRQGSQAEWDSLAHALLVAAIEDEFGLGIDAADSLDLTSFEAMQSYLEERRG